jgi:hypothetical protein
MDKGRHPNVVRTWTVERTKVQYRPLKPVKTRPDLLQPKKKSTARLPHRNAGSDRSGSQVGWQ